MRNGFVQANTNTLPMTGNCEPRRPARMFTVRGRSRNSGRSFYTCQKKRSEVEECDFFLWTDEAQAREKIEDTSNQPSAKMTKGSIMSQSTALSSDSRQNVFAGFVARPLSPEPVESPPQNKLKSDTGILAEELGMDKNGYATKISSDQPSLGDCGNLTSETITELEDDSCRSSLSPSLRPPQSDSESNSSDEEQDLVVQKEQRAALLDCLMGHFLSMFASCGSPVPSTRGTYRECTGSESSRIDAPVDISRGSTTDGYRPNTSTNNRRKRLPDDGDDHDDGGNSKRIRVQGSLTYSNKRLACPYFKKKPSRYHTWRSCPGPGWETTHRLKYALTLLQLV